MNCTIENCKCSYLKIGSEWIDIYSNDIFVITQVGYSIVTAQLKLTSFCRKLRAEQFFNRGSFCKDSSLNHYDQFRFKKSTIINPFKRFNDEFLPMYLEFLDMFQKSSFNSKSGCFLYEHIDSNHFTVFSLVGTSSTTMSFTYFWSLANQDKFQLNLEILVSDFDYYIKPVTLLNVCQTYSRLKDASEN